MNLFTLTAMGNIQYEDTGKNIKKSKQVKKTIKEAVDKIKIFNK